MKYLPSGILKEHSTGLLRSNGFAIISPRHSHSLLNYEIQHSVFNRAGIAFHPREIERISRGERGRPSKSISLSTSSQIFRIFEKKLNYEYIKIKTKII